MNNIKESIEDESFQKKAYYVNVYNEINNLIKSIQTDMEYYGHTKLMDQIIITLKGMSDTLESEIQISESNVNVKNLVECIVRNVLYEMKNK